MVSTQSELISQEEAQVAFLSVRIVSIAEVLRLIPISTGPRMDNQTLESALTAFSREGIARHAASLEGRLEPDQLAKVLTEVLDAVEESPLPGHEWSSLVELLGEDLLEKLVGVSSSSVHRYRGGERGTPDHIADRLHFVALVVADLAGSYNDFGIRRWFGRSRSALDGSAPAEMLSGNWGPRDEGALKVRALAASLLAPLAA